MRRETTGSLRPRRPGRNRRVTAKTGPGPARRAAHGLVVLLAWVLGAAAFAGGVVGVHYGWRALSSCQRLRVAAIELVGNERVRRAEIHAYTGLALGDSILRVDLDAAALALRRHPWVQSVRVKRRLPDRIVIEVDERQPRVVVCLGELYLANGDGELFKKLGAEDGVVLPVVTGLTREQAAENPERTAARVREGVELVDAAESRGGRLGRVEELHWDADLGWSLVVRPGEKQRSLRLHLGSRPLERLDHAVAALNAFEERQCEPEILWVDSVKNPGRVVARLRREPGDGRTIFAKAR